MIGHSFYNRYQMTEAELHQRELRAIAMEVRRARRATAREHTRQQVRRQFGGLLIAAGQVLAR